MKKLIKTMIVSSFISSSLIFAMQIPGETLTTANVYQPSKIVVEKTMSKLGYSYMVDDDGDLLFNIGKKEWKAYVVFNTLSDGTLWNLELLAQFTVDPKDYQKNLAYANNWNSKKKFPKISLIDKKTMRITSNYPIQFGFNPDEFKENILEIFVIAVNQIAEDIYK